MFLSVTPRIAIAEDWETVANAKYWCLTNVVSGSFGPSNISLSVDNTERSGINTLKPTSSTVGNVTGISSTTVMYAIVPITGGNITADKKFRINTDEFTMRLYYYASSGSSISYYTAIPQSVRYWVFSGGWKSVSPVNGVFSYPGYVQYVAVSFNTPGASVLNSKYSVGLYQWDSTFCNLKVQVADGEPTFETAIQNQTDTIMNTDGSDSVGSDAVTSGQNLIQGANFVQQTGSFVSQSFGAITDSEASEGLYFPGLTIMGYSIIPVQNVAFTGYLGSEVEQNIKNGVTLVLFLAWMAGLISIYHRMFLGEQEVEVVEE